ncbi:MAG: DUF5683 domain-containing protein [Bacteroidales bacterium]|nr:DUF5683 domain-containing protein [Bacteroidales bacterium]
MKSIVRTYCLLVSILFTACFYPSTGANCACAEVTDSIGIKMDTLTSRSLKGLHSDVKTNLLSDSAAILSAEADSLKEYKPSPQKAIWYSALCPGLGQLYNRRYWKLPIVAASIVGIAYAIGWNGKYYNAYTNAYRDISDNDPNTNSYKNLLSTNASGYNESQLITVFKNRQETFRRYRDLSIIGAVGVYLICMIDAYVDAQLYDFDISPDLTLQPQRQSPGFGGAKGLELSLAFHF